MHIFSLVRDTDVIHARSLLTDRQLSNYLEYRFCKRGSDNTPWQLATIDISCANQRPEECFNVRQSLSLDSQELIIRLGVSPTILRWPKDDTIQEP